MLRARPSTSAGELSLTRCGGVHSSGSQAPSSGPFQPQASDSGSRTRAAPGAGRWEVTQGVRSWLPRLLRAGCAASGEGVLDPNVPDCSGPSHRGSLAEPTCTGAQGEPDAAGTCCEVKWKGQGTSRGLPGGRHLSHLEDRV